MAQDRFQTDWFRGARAVGYMSLCKIKNSLRSLFTDPRKLVPFLLFAVMIAGPLTLVSSMTRFTSGMRRSYNAQYWRTTNAQNRARAGRTGTPGQMAPSTPMPSNFNPSTYQLPKRKIDPAIFTAAITLAFILVAIMVINAGLGERLLALSPPDVDYLFPAPISRRVILAYRLPALTFASVGIGLYVLFFLNMFTQTSEPDFPNQGHTMAAWWVNLAALTLSGSIYFNLAMFISIQAKKTKFIQRAFQVSAFALIAMFAVAASQSGVETANTILQSPILRWGLLPSTLGSDTLIAAYSHHPTGTLLAWLLVGYALSLIPMFATNKNWYEQSIMVTDKVMAIRQAAKGGMAGLMAARAANFKYKGTKDYTVSPFGTGAMALFWAHLCAAAKRPWANFGIPLAAGIGAAILAAKAVAAMVNRVSASNRVLNSRGGHIPSAASAILSTASYAILFVILLYMWLGFMTTSRTASEASIRRRELTSPLPISGWQSVAADMGVPMVAVLICFFAAALTFAILGGSNWPLVAFGLAILLPLRLSNRIVLQHILIIAYPDLADKIQRLISQWISMFVSLPFVVVEAVVCLPALFLQNIWLGMICVTLVQVPLLILALFLAGRASERAIASGEPVRIFRLLSSKG